MQQVIARVGRARGPRHRIRGAIVALIALAGTGTGILAISSPAGAASVSVSDASFTWGLSTTATAASPVPGSCNFLSAGTAGDTGSSTAWTTTSPSPGYSTQAGNVVVEKPDTSGTYSQPTFATKCQQPNGTAVTSTVGSGTRVKFSNGTGSVDTAAHTASITWNGSFTSVFYGGLIYWSASNPTLTVNADGTATLIATLAGYGSSQTSGGWTTLSPTQVTLATLTGVTVTASGFTVTPNYAGVTVNVPSGASPQASGGGSFPQSFVDFQGLTGESSYWYNSGSGDAGKPALPITVAYTTSGGPSVPAVNPVLTVTPSANVADGSSITISGSGYDTTTPNLQGTGNAGAYVEVGWINLTGWKPSAGAAATTRAYASAVWVHGSQTTTTATQAPLSADGTFSVSVPINRSALLAKQFSGGTLAVFTVAAGGQVSAGSEAYVPITLAPSPSELTISATVVEAPGDFSWSIDSTSHAVTLTQATNQGTYLESTGSLLPVIVSDTRAGSPQWSVTGQVGNFTGGLSGKYLGWTPKITVAGGGATAGAAVATGIASGNGLTDASALATAAVGHAKGSATLGADLDLRLPVDTAAGTYTATLTLTALS